MPEQTTNLKLPIPLGNENVNRQFFVDLIQAIDIGAVSEEKLTEQVKQITEGKQNVLRLADNYLAASVLVNAAADAQGRAYPDGMSLFKVTSAVGGWPTASGYVLTMRAGDSGQQMFYETYAGTVQSDKTARQWTRSKRDGNGFWQDWARGLTENDLDDTTSGTSKTKAATADAVRRVQAAVDTLQTKTDNPRANLVANGTFSYGTVGWNANPIANLAGWTVSRSGSEVGAEIAYMSTTGAGVTFLESLPFPIFAGGTYHVSSEFYAEGYATADFWLELVGIGTGGNTSILAANYCVSADRWARRGRDVVVPAGFTAAVIRLVVGANRAAGFKGFRRIQVTAGPGAQPFNGLSDGTVAKRVGSFLMEERYIELGLNVPGDGPAYIDFHTSSKEVDYNSRIISQYAGATGSGKDSLTYLAGGGHYFDAPVYVQGTDLKKSVSDGKAAVRAAITGKGGTVADADGDGIPTHAELAAGVNSIKQGGFIETSIEYAVAAAANTDYPLFTVPAIKNSLAITPIQSRNSFGSYSAGGLLYIRQGSTLIRVGNGEGGTTITINISKKQLTSFRVSDGSTAMASLAALDFNQPFSFVYRTDGGTYNSAGHYFYSYVSYS